MLVTATPAAGQQVPGADRALDSLLNTRISSASKYSQTAAEAPASVTIVTADEIRLHGYTDLEELLESVRAMYITNDHNYAYLGTRGFSRPADYNSRVLLMVDGHTVNEKLWGGAGIGSDFPLNLDAVERIEIVRGPGSVIMHTHRDVAMVTGGNPHGRSSGPR